MQWYVRGPLDLEKAMAKEKSDGDKFSAIGCPSSNGLGQSELFRDGGSGSFGFEIRRLSTDVSIVAV